MTQVNLQLLVSDLTSGDDAVAEKSVPQIAALGAKALPALFPLLDSADPENRWWALRVLAEIQHPDIPPQLCAALHDSDTSVRQCAALGLSGQPSAAAIADLAALLGDEDRLLARLSGDALHLG